MRKLHKGFHFCCKKAPLQELRLVLKKYFFPTGQMTYPRVLLGVIFCDNCTSHRLRLPDKGYKDAVRVCKPCFENVRSVLPLLSSPKETHICCA